jgi:hypothetical protein
MGDTRNGFKVLTRKPENQGVHGRIILKSVGECLLDLFGLGQRLAAGSCECIN